MISIEESIPTKSDSYRIGEDVFFYQFNDVFHYYSGNVAKPNSNNWQ